MITIILGLDILNASFLYACNTQRGTVTKGSTIIQGKDIVVYNYGFDVMGDSHVKRSFPPDVAQDMKDRSKNEMNIRLFNSDDYGHYKFSDLDAIKSMYPYDETRIDLNSFNPFINKKRAADSQKLFNSERIGLELMKYKRMLNHSESTYEYINTKEQVRSYLEKFKDYRKDLDKLL